MNSFDQAMSKLFGKDWKSTAGAYLTVALTAGGFLTSYLATIQNPTHWQVALSGGLTTALTIMKLLVGHMTVDSGTTLALVQGDPKPEVVPSHEIPDDPTAKPVKE